MDFGSSSSGDGGSNNEVGSSTMQSNAKFQVPASIFAEPNMEMVKRNLTLNVANQQQQSSGTTPANLHSLQTPQLSLAQLGLTSQSPGASSFLRSHNLIPLLESPDLKMLALGSPELECMLAVLSPMHSPFTPAARLQGGNADEMDFVSALNEFYQRSRQTTPDKVSPKANQWNVNVAQNGETKDESPTVVRPVPQRPGVPCSSKATVELQRDDSRPTTSNTLLDANTAKRLTAFMQGASRRLAAVANSKSPAGTPVDDYGGPKTFMLLDNAQNTVVAQPNVLPLPNNGSTLLIPSANQPGTVLLTTLPSTIVQLTGLNVPNQLVMQNANANGVGLNSSNLQSNVATQQQSAISSSSQSKSSRRSRRKVSDSDSTTSVSATPLANQRANNRSSPVPIAPKATGSRKQYKKRSSSPASKKTDNGKRARRDSNDCSVVAPSDSLAQDDGNSDDDDDDAPNGGGDKLSRKRERNRLAAQRCRERKVKRIGELQQDVSKLEAEKQELRDRIDELTRTVDVLQRRIEKHENSGCHVPVSPDESNAKGQK